VALISVIIVNWNSKELVRNCILSLTRQPVKTQLEIVVVDSGSHDGCGAIMRTEFPNAIFVQLNDNVGFGVANNAGFKRATGEFIWLLNPDTEIVGDAADVLLSTLQSQRGVGMVGAKLLNSDGSLQTTCVQSLPTFFNQAFDSELLRRLFRIWGMAAFRSDFEPVEVEAISGACMMLRAIDFSSVGCFDARYFMYCEDMDLCRAIRNRGLRIMYVPQAAVFHHGGRSSKNQVSKFSVVMTREATAKFFEKQHGQLGGLAYRCFLGASATARILFLVLYRIPLYALRRPISDSLTKWIIIFKWCVGIERPGIPSNCK
jgi:GT2 family glycosyltransferase